MRQITLKNTYHCTEARIRVAEEGETLLSRGTVNRVRRALCGIKGCTCGDALGSRGGNRGYDIAEMPNGEVLVRYIG